MGPPAAVCVHWARACGREIITQEVEAYSVPWCHWMPGLIRAFFLPAALSMLAPDRWRVIDSLVNLALVPDAIWRQYLPRASHLTPAGKLFFGTTDCHPTQ